MKDFENTNPVQGSGRANNKQHNSNSASESQGQHRSPMMQPRKTRHSLPRLCLFVLQYGVLLRTTSIAVQYWTCSGGGVGALAASTSTASRRTTTTIKVAVLGATGRLGRETIARLSKKGISTRCLVRPQRSSSSSSKQDIVASLKTLSGVELVEGDVTDSDSLQRLLDSETTACLALYGPTAPKPFLRSVFLPAWLFPENDPAHPKQINYEGIKKLLAAMEASAQCRRLVRITGKGEQPVCFV